MKNEKQNVKLNKTIIIQRIIDLTSKCHYKGVALNSY